MIANTARTNDGQLVAIAVPQGNVRVARTDWQKMGLHQTASGYGSRLLTCYQVAIGNVWHRVYCARYSNSGTCYIKKCGFNFIVHFEAI